MSRKLILGIPNKGRLQKQTVDFLKENGLEIERGRGDRGYVGKLIGYDNIELIFSFTKRNFTRTHERVNRFRSHWLRFDQ